MKTPTVLAVSLILTLSALYALTGAERHAPALKNTADLPSAPGVIATERATVHRQSQIQVMASAAANRHKQRIEIGEGQRDVRDRLPRLDEMLAIPSINPKEIDLPTAERVLLDELLFEQCLKIDDLRKMLNQEMHRVMDERLAAGDAEPFVEGVTSMAREGYVAVNIASEEGKAWVVRISEAEIPDWRVINDAIGQIKQETHTQFVDVVDAHASKI